jgi:SagB-type dehydrogenase family enzyme
MKFLQYTIRRQLMTKRPIVTFASFSISLFILVGGIIMLPQFVSGREPSEIIKLPEPKYDSQTSFERALQQRRSIRDYLDEPLTLAEVSQLLWAAQGVTDPHGYRTAPSAGALYPLEVYLVAGQVSDLAKGVYKYRPQPHELIKLAEGDQRRALASAALGQSCVANGSVVIVITAVYARTMKKYRQRGIQYVHIEVGHAAQNVYLQTVSLYLGTVIVGAFSDDAVKKVLNLPDEEQPLCIMPVGRIK